MKRLGTALLAGSIAASSFAAFAQEPGNARMGRDIAQIRCAECHAVGKGALRSRNSLAPTFETLAIRRDVSEMGLRSLLRHSHREMPAQALKDNEAADLAAYILTLR
jgi:mono/diheme cytochrome c family protein